jgi:hypothetical protein
MKRMVQPRHHTTRGAVASPRHSLTVMAGLVPAIPISTSAATDRRDTPHAHQDKGHAGEKSSPLPLREGVGGRGRRPEVEPATYAATVTCAGATPPPSPLPARGGGVCCSRQRLILMHMGTRPAMT